MPGRQLLAELSSAWGRASWAVEIVWRESRHSDLDTNDNKQERTKTALNNTLQS